MGPDLETSLKRLMLFRVVMVTTLLLVATYVEAFSETLLAHNPLYFVIIGTYAVTLVHALALRLLPRQVVQAYVQLILDLVTITALVYVTGGVRTGFLLLYPLSLLSATMLVPRRGALSLAGLATVLYGALIAAVRLGLPAPEGLADVQVVPARVLIYAVFVLGVACATVVLLGAYLAESLRHAGRQLHEAAVQVADLRELNQVIIDSIQSGLMTTDGEGRILYVNAFGERILGRQAASVRGAGVREVFGSPLLGPAELRARSALRALARLGVTYAQPDGRTLQLGVTVTPLATKEAPRGHLIVFQDLTDIRRLEQEVRTKEKLAAVGEMAAQLAHEIRNPLGSIRGSAQVLMGEPALGEEQGHLLDIISRESKRLSDTLNQFLYQARPQQPPADPVDLRPIVESALTLLRNGSEVRPDHLISLHTDEGPHLCLADPDQIAQVLWNLARNALEAMPNGGRLDVSLLARGGDVVLTVRDQGRGIASEDQRRIFQPFHAPGAPGTGLGLSIVYRIVREHGGDISVRSAPQRGTEFEVRLPQVALPDAGEVAP
jgi:two-component system sensor histidine kinase PilS (NtrC family)